MYQSVPISQVQLSLCVLSCWLCCQTGWSTQHCPETQHTPWPKAEQCKSSSPGMHLDLVTQALVSHLVVVVLWVVKGDSWHWSNICSQHSQSINLLLWRYPSSNQVHVTCSTYACRYGKHCM